MPIDRPADSAARECRYCGDDAVGEDALGRPACKRHIEEVADDAPAAIPTERSPEMQDWLDGEPRRYRKRPVVIEAARLGEFNGAGIAEWCGGVLRGGPDGGSRNGTVLIHTLEGDHTALVGDYVIKGVAGEFYPCKPDIFEQTYEAVDA